MLSSRTLTRAAPRTSRAFRSPRLNNPRFQSTTSSASNAPPAANHFASGVAGGLAGATLLYGIYTMTPSGRMASKINKAAKEADKKYQQAAATLRDKAPSTDEAIGRVKQFCYSYVAWVPGGRAYVDTAFDDLNSIRERNSDEVDKLVSDTYAKFQDIAKSGLSMESAGKTYEALADMGRKLAKLAINAGDEILERHPQLKEKVGGPLDQLKQMGDQYGPEAKKMVDETWDQIGDVLSGGFSVASVDKIRKLVEEKSQKLKKFGEQAWEKGLEQAKPYLEKNPKVKELIMENQDALKQGNATALFKEVKGAVEGGNLEKLEEYVKQAVDKAKGSAGKGTGSIASSTGIGGSIGGLGQLLGVSGKDAGESVQKNIQALSDIMNNHSSEAKKLLEETRDDLKKLLEDKASKAQKIVEGAKSSQ
ncbi:hypothetical protein OQA88_999 [Cercophora sp. LCS_1]